MPDVRRYDLHAIDGRALPVALRYDASACLVTRGTLLVREAPSPLGDGQVQLELFGEIDGRPGPNAAGAIFWLGEEFDRLDARHLVVPGGFRKRELAPELVATYGADGVEFAPVSRDAPAGVVEQLFGARRWCFRAADPGEAPATLAAG